MRILKLLSRVTRQITPIRDFKLRSVCTKALLVLFIFAIPLLSYSQDKNQIKAKTEALKSQQGTNKPEPNAVNRAVENQPLEILTYEQAQENQTNNKQELQTDERCGATLIEEMIKSQYPNRKSTEQFEQWMKNSINTLKQRENSSISMRAVYTIPVVIHVIHNGGAVGTLPNISDAQAISQVAILNEDFRRLNADADNTPEDFLPVAADVELQFVLATVDPDGNTTNGINRYNGGQASYSIANMESNIKPNTIWHPDFYFNIWCAPLQGGLLGYAQFPSASTLPGFDNDEGPSYTDGIVVRDFAFGLNGTSQPPFNLGRTTTHEAGHFFGLRHIGGDGSCAVDDFCADTPTQDGQNNNFVEDCSYPADNDCDDGPGDLPDQFMNYMDYSDDGCMNLFTQDQKTRVDVVMELSPRRESLIKSQVGNGIPPDYPYDPYADAPENDLCSGAIPLECGDEVFGSTSSASPLEQPQACSPETEAPGVWYSIIGDGTPLTASLCNGTDYDSKIGIYSGSCGALVCEGGDDDGCGGIGVPSELTINTTDGETYYIFVTGWNGSKGNYVLTITCGEEPPNEGPENDFCEGAIAIECGETISGTTVGAIQDLSGTCGTPVSAPGVWYNFVGTGEFVIASLCDQANYDTKINIIEALDCNSELFCVTGNDDGPGCGGFTSEATFFSESGVNYYIYVNGFFGETGDFDLSITCVPPAENDLCENAIALDCDSQVEGSTRFSTAADVPSELDCAPDDFGDLLGNGVWYTITGTGGEIILSTCGTADYDTKLDVYTGECGALECYAGNDDGPGCPGFTSELTFASEEGVTYYIYVSGYTSSSFGTSIGDFTLNIDCVCLADAGECATVYNGYEPASCTDLTASMAYGEGPYDYQWSNGDSGETITVCPAETTTYTVTITDALGCIATDDVTVEVIDVSCGKNEDKVLVYHNPNGPRPKTLCISSDDVEDHLAHGDILGPEGTEVNCGDPYTGEGDTSTVRIASNSLNDKWSLSPNPANGKVNLNLENYLGRDLRVQVLDFSGEILIEKNILELKSSRYDLNIREIPYGIYFVRLSTDSETIIKKLIVIR